MKRILTAMGMVLLLGLSACATAPVTGRNQLILVPEEQDEPLGVQAFNEIKRQEPTSSNRDLAVRVEQVGRRIAAISPRPDWDWEFVLFASEQPNAFALPGGKVGVYEGLFKVARNDAQLAAVMGHEVAHATARHGAERMSQGIITNLGLQTLGATGFGEFADLAAQAATLGVILPFSRTQESEADAIGLQYMAAAGYDPREAVELWRNFEALGGERPPEFLSTHPSEGSRIERLQNLMPQALEIYRQAQG